MRAAVAYLLVGVIPAVELAVMQGWIDKTMPSGLHYSQFQINILAVSLMLFIRGYWDKERATEERMRRITRTQLRCLYGTEPREEEQ